MINQDELNKIRQDTDIAIKEGWDRTKIEWRKATLKIIYVLCSQEPTITANDFTEIIKAMPLKTHDNRAIGGVVRIAQKFKWIVKTGEEEISKAGHLSKIQVWKSLLFGKVKDEEDPVVESSEPKMDWHRSSRTYVDLGNGKFVVNGTRGKQYRVIIIEKKRHCQCESFKFCKAPKSCRHIRMILSHKKKIEERKESRAIERRSIPLF